MCYYKIPIVKTYKVPIYKYVTCRIQEQTQKVCLSVGILHYSMVCICMKYLVKKK